MKKMFGVLIVLAFVSSICFAQEAVKTLPNPAKASSVAAETKTIVGKVISVTVADPAKGIINGAISIGDKAGKTLSYTVSPVAEVLDTTFRTITLNQLKVGDKVKVKAKKTAAGEEAKSVTLLK